MKIALKTLLPVLAVTPLIGACAMQNTSENESGSHLTAVDERRLQKLEQNIADLNEQLSLANNRVYEVRNSKGRRTDLTVVPVTGSQSDAAAQTLAQQVAAAPASKTVAKTPAKPKTSKAKVEKPKPVAPKESKPPVVDTSAINAMALPPTGNPELPPTTQSNNSSADTFNLPPENLTPSAVPAPSVAPAPVASKAAPGEEAQYKAALKLARAGKNAESIRQFQDLLQKYPNGRYAPNAHYWIGECLYSQKNYRAALEQFQTVNAKYPKHHKNADALLKAGLTSRQIGDSQGASEKIQTLMRNFPGSEAARVARRQGLVQNR